MHTTPDESESLLKIEGTLDIGCAEELRQALQDLLARASAPMLDLSQVDACDTAAIQLLLAARISAAQSGRQLELTATSPALDAAGATLGLSLHEPTPRCAAATKEDSRRGI